MNLFNEEYYIEQKLQQLANTGQTDANGLDYTKETLYDALEAAGLTAREHYDLYGWKEGLNPSSIFDNESYLYEKLELDRKYAPDISQSDFLANFAQSGLSPLQHFEQHGNNEWLSPTTLFDVDEYLAAKAEHDYGSATTETLQAVCDSLAAAGLSPWDDFLQNGAAQDINPSDAFDMSVYVQDKYELDSAGDPTLTSAQDMLARIEEAGLNPLTHYLLYGQYEGLRASGDYSANVVDLGDGLQAHVLGLDYLTLEDLTSTYVMNEGYSVTGIVSDAIVDAEKTVLVDYTSPDNMMCWAASATDLLSWSGWATEAGFKPTATEDLEDVVFQEFINSFTNGDISGGFTVLGLTWFFDASWNEEMSGTDEDSSLPIAGTGNYLNTSADEYISAWAANTHDYGAGMHELAAIAESIDQGNMVGLGIYSQVGLAHAITGIGYVVNTNYDADDPRYYAGLLITDSDNSRVYADAGESADSVQYFALEWDGSSYVNGLTTTNVYGEDYEIIIDEYTALALNEDWNLA